MQAPTRNKANMQECSRQQSRSSAHRGAYPLPDLFPVLLLFIFSTPLAAQRNFGVVFDETSYRAVPLIEPASGVKGIDFPSRLSLRPFCPVPGDQRDISSCTAFATGYAAMSVAAAVRLGMTDSAALAQSAFSAAFIYNQVKKIAGDCREGIAAEDALRFLKNNGNCRYVNFDTARNCAILPDARLRDSAGNNQIRDFAAVLPFGATSTQTVNILLNFLRDSVPVIVVLRAYEHFVRPDSGATVWSRLPGERELGLHCLLVTGYDEAERSFEVMSSWGPEWADGGFHRVNWSDMGTAAVAAYALFTERHAGWDNMPKRAASAPGLPTLGAYRLEGALELVRLEPDGTPYAAEVLRRDPFSGFYTPIAGAFPVNTLYQLHSSGTAGGQYIYVFSCDARGVAQAHYPKPFFSALSPGRHALITVPSAQSALQLVQAGDDLVCVLYCEREIPDFRARLHSMQGGQRGNFSEKFKEAFGDLVVEANTGNHIEYAQNQMRLRADVSAGRGTVVPMVLWLQAK